MSRITRRNWTEDKFGIVSKGSLPDLFDNTVKSVYRITDQEYDLLAEKMTETEMNLFITENPTYAEKRVMIQLLNKYIDYSVLQDQ